MKSRPDFNANASLSSQVFCCKYYISIPDKTLSFCKNENWSQKYPHPLNPNVLALIYNIFQIFLFC